MDTADILDKIKSFSGWN
jgi:tRNA (mo5U34)-methyltransferase